MKLAYSLLPAAAMALAASSTLADEPYFRLQYGRTLPDAQIIDRTDMVEAIADLDIAGDHYFGAALGFERALSPRWGVFAGEGEFAYRALDINNVQIGGTVPSGFIDGADLESISAYSFMGNVWWRPKLFDRIQPYFGGGVGGAYLPSGGLAASNLTSFAYQLGGGLDYEFRNGVRAGLGYRHFETSAKDIDDSDPLFTFETDTQFSENTFLASVTVPFFVFNGDEARQGAASSGRTDAERQAQAQRDAARARRETAKRARKQAKRKEKAQKEAAKKAAKKTQKETRRTAQAEQKNFLRRLNPFSRKDGPSAPVSAKDELQSPALPATAPSATVTPASPPPLRDAAPSGFATIETVSVAPAAGASAPSPKSAALGVTRITADEIAASALLEKNETASSASEQISEPAALPTEPALAPAPAPVIAAAEQQPDKAYYAQLGAYSTESLARDMWRLKSGRQPEIFNGAAHVIKRRVRRSDNKLLYLLQAGPYDERSARALCALVESDCFVAGR